MSKYNFEVIGKDAEGKCHQVFTMARTTDLARDNFTDAFPGGSVLSVQCASRASISPDNYVTIPDVEEEMDDEELKSRVLVLAEDMVSDLLYYGRKESEHLPMDLSDRAWKTGLVTVDEFVEEFRKQLTKGVEGIK